MYVTRCVGLLREDFPIGESGRIDVRELCGGKSEAEMSEGYLGLVY